MTVQILDNTPAVLPLGKLCEEHGYSHEWITGRQPQLTKNGKKITCKTDNHESLVVPGLSTSSGSSPTSHVHLCRTRSTRTKQCTLTLYVCVRSVAVFSAFMSRQGRQNLRPFVPRRSVRYVTRSCLSTWSL